ncbi:MAG: globin [Nitrospirae bacterium]|nr:globin [Nitrospirota bacterium]
MDSVGAVQESYARCTLKGGFIDRFYDIFLASHPGLAPMFRNTDFKEQKKLLRNGISMVILFSQHNMMAANSLNRIGESHGVRGMDIRADLYSYWSNSLMQCVREFDTKLTPEVEAAWRKLIDNAVQHIIRVGK